MIEKIGYIRNPLSIIAIFAAIAEISGTTVLPFIAPNNQSIYVWFLMFFPIFLVGIFFLTLNFNHLVLYAPSDYKDEKNFVSSFSKANPKERSMKLRDEVQEVESEERNDNSTKKVRVPAEQEDESSHTTQTRRREIVADVALAERLAITRLERELGLNFKTNVKFRFPIPKKEESATGLKFTAKANIVFDAVSISKHEIHAVEVKYITANRINRRRFADVIRFSELVATQCKDVSAAAFTLHVFVVPNNPGIDIEELRKELLESTQSDLINIVLHIATLDDLENEYQNIT